MATAFLDFDGTLIDVRRRHYLAYRNASIELDSKPLDEAEYWARRLDGAANVDLVTGGADRRQFADAWLRFVESPEYLSLDTLLPGATRSMSELKKSGVGLVLVTMRRRRAALAAQLDGLDVRRFFAHIVCHGDAPPAKSKADLMRLTGCDTQGVGFVVGDSEGDIEAARAHGMLAIAIAGGVRSRRFLEELQPDAISPSIADLPRVLSEQLRCGAPSSG